MNRLRLLWCVPLLFVLAACGGGAVEPAAEVSALSPRSVEVESPTLVPTEVVAVAPESPTAVPTATAEPTVVPVPTETAEIVEAEVEESEEMVEAEELEEPEVEEVEEVVAEPAVAEVVFNGRTEEGALFRGAADAPVTLIDYSDFL